MDFADEHYVKLFTRDTVTWRSWPWEARALLPLLMRAVDHAGILSIGTREPARSVALMVNIPAEVVEPGLKAMLEDGTLEMVNGHLIIPRFNEAQESKKSNAQAKREQREKSKAMARAANLQNIKSTPADGGSPRQSAADGGRTGHPSALPCPALPDPGPSLAPREKPRAPKQQVLVEDPPDPRHHQLKVKLVEIYCREKRASGYPGFNGRHAKLITRLLEAKPAAHDPALWPIAIAAAWERALADRYPECSTLEDFEKKLAKYIGAPPAEQGRSPNGGIVERPRGECAVCGASAIGMFANIDVCGVHLRDAETQAQGQEPDEPWRADLVDWAREERAGREAAV